MRFLARCMGCRGTTASCEDESVPPVVPLDWIDLPLIARILDFLEISEQVLVAAGVCHRFREAQAVYGHVVEYPLMNPLIENRPRFQKQSIQSAYEGIRFHLTNRMPIPPSIGFGARSILFRFEVSSLRPGGGYCSLHLTGAQPGLLKVKFDKNFLHCYGNAVKRNVQRNISWLFAGDWLSLVGGDWLSLQLDFRWEESALDMYVNGTLLTSISLKHGPNGIHSVLLRGYTYSGRSRQLHDWSRMYLHRKEIAA